VWQDSPKWIIYNPSSDLYDVKVERDPKAVAYDGSAVRNPETRQTSKTLRPVVTLRPEHGYSATKYDANPVKSPKN
jgi:hypothetical protein